MKTLAASELETDVRLYLGATKKGLAYIDWREINGIIIPGKPGSGKSNTAVWIANQLAANGVKLVRMEYEADESNPQTFINQTAHLAYADYMPYAVEADDIEKNIAALYNLGMERRKEGTAANKNQFPIAVMIDEITSLLAQPSDKIEVVSKAEIEDGVTEKKTTRKKTMMDNLNDMLRMFRKANIKFVVMGQNWQASGNASKIATFRRNFNTILYHRINAQDVKLFDMATPDTQRIIQRLKPGQIFYSSTVLATPYMAKLPQINTDAKIRASEYIQVTHKNNSAPLIQAKKYPRLDGRWTKTRVLAYLLGIDFKTLKQKDIYNRGN